MVGGWEFDGNMRSPNRNRLARSARPIAATAAMMAASLLVWGQEDPPPPIEIDPPLPQDDPAFVENMEDIDPKLLEQLEKVLGNEAELLIDNAFANQLADPAMLADVVRRIPNARLHWLETADHSFKILKRSRQSRVRPGMTEENVYHEAARVTAAFVQELI